MGRSSICEKTGLTRGTWTPEEDRLLTAYIKRYGHWNWRELPKYAALCIWLIFLFGDEGLGRLPESEEVTDSNKIAMQSLNSELGLSRCGKSCRLRWMNYLRPNIKRGDYTREEDELIINLHAELGNRWSAIAARLPGRTDNEIKNHWHTHLQKRTKRTTIVKEAKPKPNIEHGAVGRRESAVPNCVHPNDITPLILESSAVIPISPPKSSDFSSSSTYDSEVVISENQGITDDSEISSDGFIEYDGNFWTEPFLVEDSYKVNDTMPVFVNEYSVSPLAEALYPYDLYNGCDMDMLFNY
ncbi:hypothetical protein AQUCO_03000246v1 [Aquilegia coerulea]|uniref:Uncharacterized protein n=1 Tax=Aquilegia coerulea TaxID=218851 RepID=A0A2G5D1Y7_AQUCA|nr:hypothetical protein AQUCO_03000246v1 [Aquilegia coerulea]